MELTLSSFHESKSEKSLRRFHPFDCDWWSVAVSPSRRTWRSCWGRTGPTGRASCCTSPRYTSTLRPERWQRPGGGGPPLCPETLRRLSFTSRRHGRRSPDRLTFDPNVGFLTQSEVPKKAVCGSTCRGARETAKARLRWTHQATLPLSQAYVGQFCWNITFMY